MQLIICSGNDTPGISFFLILLHCRYQREEAKIQAWVNLESAKAEAQSRKLEVNLIVIFLLIPLGIFQFIKLSSPTKILHIYTSPELHKTLVNIYILNY